MIANIPKTLREYKQWVLWRDEDGRKVPYQVNGFRASSVDPAHWAAFQTVADAYQKRADHYSGIGFVFTNSDSLVGIDIDDCITNGKVTKHIHNALCELGTYAEMSPSGTGIKIWVSVPGFSINGRKFENGLEIYSHSRYFTVTGLRLRGMAKEPATIDKDILLDWAETNFGIILEQDPQREAPALQTVVLDESTAPKINEPDWLKAYPVEERLERALRYLDHSDPAIEGQGGDKKTFTLSCTLIRGFALPPAQAWQALHEYNKRCLPPWTERELANKLKRAYQATRPSWGELLAKPRMVVTPELLQREPVAVPLGSILNAAKNETDDKTGFFTTGITALDEAVGGGFKAGELVLFGGRPGHGKSVFGIQVAWEAAKQDKRVLYISEEMAAIAIARRLLQRANQIGIDDEQLRNISDKILVAESCGTLTRACTMIESVENISLVVVDYAQLLATQRAESRYAEASAVSLAMRQIATRLRLPIVLLVQLNRGAEGAEEYRMGHIRDSGQFEQDADMILFGKLLRTKTTSNYKITVAKNRHRPIKSNLVTCNFIPDGQLFVDCSGPQGSTLLDSRSLAFTPTEVVYDGEEPDLCDF